MLKRIFFLVLCCILALTSAFAEESLDIPEDLTAKEVIDVQAIRGELDVADEMTDSLRAGEVKSSSLSGLSIPLTADVVSVGSDGTLTVMADGIALSVLPPFGTMAFGQDALIQLDVYSMFTDPAGMVEYLQAIGAHMCIVDLTAGTEIYAMVGWDIVSTIIEDIDEVSPVVLSLLIDRLQEVNPDAYISLTTCGEHSFIVYDYRRSGSEMIIFSSVKNNTNIDFLLVPGGDSISDFDVSMIEGVLADAQLYAI